MICEAKSLKLIKIYLYICERYNEELKYHCQRFINNNEPKLTDQEIITIYLFVVNEEQRFKIKQIHLFAKDYLGSWFAKLGPYAAFNNRINRLSTVFSKLGSSLISEFKPDDCSLEMSLLDSMPIVTCSGKRKALVASKLVSKSYCSTKNM
jgi:hypothetical protein